LAIVLVNRSLPDIPMHRIHLSLLPAVLIAGLIGFSQALAEPTHLLRQPALSADHIAFVYAGDLWLADRDGSQPAPVDLGPEAEENNPTSRPTARHDRLCWSLRGQCRCLRDFHRGRPAEAADLASGR
jgi:hypothetical protein